MGYSSADARVQLLDAIAEATDRIGAALAALGDAYEQLDEYHADDLEEQLFRPVQGAYGKAKRIHAEFAGRHGLPAREFGRASALAPSTSAKDLIAGAVEGVDAADHTLSALQDSLMPVEVGDPELRAGLAELREQLDGLRRRAREVVRTLGR
jgi:hypothetical protein